MAYIVVTGNKRDLAMQPDLQIKVDGIPCGAVVRYWHQAIVQSVGCHPDNALPDDTGELEWYIVDRRGRHAPWLEAKMTDDEREEIERQIIQSMWGEEL